MSESRIHRMLATIATAAYLLTAIAVQAALPNPPANVCINGVCASGAVSQPPPSSGVSGNAVKFHPGTYVAYSPSAVNGIPGHRLDLPTQRKELLDFIGSVCQDSAIRGIQISPVMRALEGDTAGDYRAGFAAIDAIIAKLEACNKRLIMSVQTVWYGGIKSPYDIFPAYIVDTPSLGWTAGDPQENLSMRKWQQATADRIIALVQAYGSRYNTHPFFEMISFDETSMQIKSDGYSIANLLVQYKRILASARAAWRNTAIRLGANDMGALGNLADLMQYCKAYYCAVGGPDVWPGDIGDANAVFVGKQKMGYPGIGIPGNGDDVYEDLRDKLPWVAEVQWQSLDGRFSLQQLWNAPSIGYDPTDGDFHMPTMKNRYMIWYANYVNGNASTQWSTGILPFIHSVNGAVASTACPTLYPACNAN